MDENPYEAPQEMAEGARVPASGYDPLAIEQRAIRFVWGAVCVAALVVLGLLAITIAVAALLS
jgi:hypothetical protein